MGQTPRHCVLYPMTSIIYTRNFSRTGSNGILSGTLRLTTIRSILVCSVRISCLHKNKIQILELAHEPQKLLLRFLHYIAPRHAPSTYPLSPNPHRRKAGMRLPMGFSQNGPRSAWRIVLKFCIANGTSLAQLLSKKWLGLVRSRSYDVIS